MQQGKFKQFKAFWNEKEQELKEIDFQLQKVCSLFTKLCVIYSRPPYNISLRTKKLSGLNGLKLKKKEYDVNRREIRNWKPRD